MLWIWPSLLSCPLATAGTEQGRTGSPGTETPHESVAGDLPPIPEVQFAAPEGHENFAAYQDWVAQELHRLEQAAEQPDDPAERRVLLTTAANHALAHGLSLAATCRVLSIKGGVCDQDAAALIARVEKLLGRARIDPGQPEGRIDQEADPAAAPDTVDRKAALHDFAKALRAAMSPDRSLNDAGRAAASGLSRWREDPDPGISSAAGLWQAFIRSAEMDRTPALSILGLATTDPKPGTLPFAFFGRLLRCRLVAQDSPAAALALLLQLEERCQTWFSGPQQEFAARTCAFVRLQILRQWCDRLDDPEKEEERRWCVDQVEKLTSDVAMDPVLLPLSPVIPLMVTRDEAAPAQPASDPATPDDPE